VIKYYEQLIQGSPEWLQARCGLLTASEMKLIITAGKLQAANNDKSRAHVYEILAQQITGYTEPSYISDDMLRGREDEVDARDIYADNYGDVAEVGFITNDRWGFTLGYSPDGLVGDDGLIEIKSRRQKYQAETIISQRVPDEYMFQLQTGLLVSERKWCDFISYCGGMPMVTIRVEPDAALQEAILKAAGAFYEQVNQLMTKYTALLSDGGMRLVPTERKIEQEITI